MEPDTLENGLVMSEMDMVCRCGLISLAMKGTGNLIKLTERGLFIMRMGMFTQVNGKMTKHMGLENTRTTMEQLTKETGRKTSKTEKELRPGQTEQNTLVNTRMGRNTVKVSFILLTRVCTKENFLKTKSQVRAFTHGMTGSAIKANGNKTKWTGEEF